jgi:Arc/MetJ-type ribon-helix-helix transcriptional regulator
MQQKDRISTLAATVQAEQNAKRKQVPRYDRFAKADAALNPLVSSQDPDSAENGVLEPQLSASVDTETSRGERIMEPSTPEVLSLKVIRETFSLPPGDVELIRHLRNRCLRAGIYVSKSELVRAGLRTLQGLVIEDLCSAVSRVEKLPVGRAAKSYNRMKRS